MYVTLRKDYFNYILEFRTYLCQ